jgi:Xaa-Pro aminopeptidase
VTNAAERLSRLRTELQRQGVDGALIPRGDEFLGEYVPASGERLAWLTGFTGSAGLAIVLPERAFLFIDGRYTTQAEREADPSLWTLRHLVDQPPAEVLRSEAAGRCIGYDPWLHTRASLERLGGSGAQLVALAANPVDAIWPDRPAAPSGSALPHPLRLAGLDSAEKREAAAARLREAGEAACVLADPHSVAWLLNLRGRDLEHTPMVLARALLLKDGAVELFIDPARADAAVRAHLGNSVALRRPEQFGERLDTLAGNQVRLDPDVTPAWIAGRLEAAGATVVMGEDPCRLPRACKNPVEQDGARAAHLRDGVAMVRFLAWFAEAAPCGAETEMSASARLLAFRAGGREFVGESFPAISGAGEHGAIVHYRATPQTNRPIQPGDLYLIDSGGQYRDGTTDVTRTLWSGPSEPPPEAMDHYTRVLRGHIALATMRFPEGVAGPHIDAVARRPLWDAGLDFDHGTGHGVGSFLSVHEGPAGISRAAKPVPLRPGMILSDEPGFYLPGRYGIRIENLLLVRAAAGLAEGGKRFLEFETLTLAPYARELIATGMLTREERSWVDSYHAGLMSLLAPMLDDSARGWLERACLPL